MQPSARPSATARPTRRAVSTVRTGSLVRFIRFNARRSTFVAALCVVAAFAFAFASTVPAFVSAVEQDSAISGGASPFSFDATVAPNGDVKLGGGSNPFGASALPGLGLDGLGSDAKLSVDAKIVPLPAQSSGADADSNADFWRAATSGRRLVGFLTLRTSVADDWHIYSPTQGAGGSPTRFSEIAVAKGSNSNSGSETAVEVGEIKLATPFKIVDFFGDSLEELTGPVDWVAPLTVAADAPFDETALATLQITGKVDALACSEGEGGACVPQKLDFAARFDAESDAAALSAVLAAAQKLAESSRTAQVAQDTQDGEKARNGESAKGATTTQNRQDAAEAQTERDAQDESAPAARTLASRGVLFLLFNAFLGGLILNVTPCVLPVIGLKILSFFEQAGRSRVKAFTLNVWYALGVGVVFAALAFASVGLSVLFTRALFQILMSAIVFAMALSLIGVWELQAPAFLGGERSNALTSKEGPVGAIFKGIITTLLAIPCGAPLLSPVLDWASETTRRGEIGLVVVVYLTIGFGMSFPFLVAGAFPELLKFFPKPGAWTETFRKTMGFFLLIAVVWILYSAPLEYQLPTTALLFALWFACWNIGRNQFEFDAAKKKTVGWVVSLLVVATTGVFAFNFPGNPVKSTLQTATANKMTRWAIRAERDGLLTQKHWSLFDRATLDAELAKGKVVVVDFTADWCMNCKFLERTILHTPETTAFLDANGVVSLTGDWTNQDAKTPDVLEINELLDANGARQVPTLMIFSPSDPEKPTVLRGLYAESTFENAVKAAVEKTQNR